MSIFRFFLICLGLTLTACGVSEIAPGAPIENTGAENTGAENTGIWTLVNAQSRLEFISVKKGTIVEIHSFSELSGTVESGGKVRVKIALDSVETNIGLRNERMRKHLFETDKTPTAILTANLDMSNFTAMAVGERKDISTAVLVYMHGKESPIEAKLTVTRLGAHKVAVNSRTPILLEINTFAMEAGVEKLRELAKLPSITPEIPVMFSLVFER